MKIKDNRLCPNCKTRSLILDVDEFEWNGTICENCSWRSIPTPRTRSGALITTPHGMPHMLDIQPNGLKKQDIPG